ncbi:MAG: ATPase, T2SS/T4P/T4SS family [Sulfuricellaceae bacterium]|nr:ATPase, T2SS/T4P/T4SS family [Sulfuricellaceae bacterium]
MEASNPATQPIGALLLQRALINAKDIDKALAFQQKFKGRFGAILVRIGAISEDALLPVLAEQLNLSLLDNRELPAQPEMILNAIRMSGLAPAWFQDQRVLVWEGADGIIRCASRNPIDSNLQETLSSVYPSHKLSWSFARTQDVENSLKLIQPGSHGESHDEIAHLRELAEEAPVVELVNNLLSQATDDGASDIHLEPEERAFTVRYRIDGVLHTRMTLPRERFDAVASRIKLISGMDIAERRLPQDGRISTRASGIEMDIRVSCVPGVNGESIVMRLLPKERTDLDLNSMGMESDHLQQFTRWINEPHGILLVTGPTGSGKSTTLYAALDKANNRARKIITVEDPVEYKMSGITQIQTQSDIGYTFSRALRAILRQDPDIIMIGEIRDLETAEIAVQSALTGHMVLSTLHTNDSLSAFTRLLDMGVEPFLVASAVRAVQAQRLVRKLCDKCAIPAAPSQSFTEATERIKVRAPHLFQGKPGWRVAKGCQDCRGSGYRGRLGIYEFLEVTPHIQEAVMRHEPIAEMLKIAQQQGYRNLREDGLIKAWRGHTSTDEVLRVTGMGEGGEIL